MTLYFEAMPARKSPNLTVYVTPVAEPAGSPKKAEAARCGATAAWGATALAGSESWLPGRDQAPDGQVVDRQQIGQCDLVGGGDAQQEVAGLDGVDQAAGAWRRLWSAPAGASALRR